MTLWLENATDDDVFDHYEITLETIIKLCLEEERYPQNIELSLTIVNNDEIQRLNNEFRNINRPTDVLSFPMINFENGVMDVTNLQQQFKEVTNNDTGDIVLGDIVISIDKAIEQAKEFGHSLKREIGFLTAHSMFHLMGYDHMTNEDEAVMKHKQEKILNALDLTR